MSCKRSFWVRFSPDSLYSFVQYIQAGQEICKKIVVIEPQDACEEIDKFLLELSKKKKVSSELNRENESEDDE